MLDNMIGVPVLYNVVSFVDFRIMKYYARRMDDDFYNENQHQHPLVIQPQLHDVETACRLLSISRSTFYLLVKEGRIVVSKLGTKTLISSYAIEKFVREIHAEGLSGNQ